MHLAGLPGPVELNCRRRVLLTRMRGEGPSYALGASTVNPAPDDSPPGRPL